MTCAGTDSFAALAFRAGGRPPPGSTRDPGREPSRRAQVRTHPAAKRAPQPVLCLGGERRPIRPGCTPGTADPSPWKRTRRTPAIGGLAGSRRTGAARSCPAHGTDRPSSTRHVRHVALARSPAGAPPPFRVRDRDVSPASGRAGGPARGEPSSPGGRAARTGSGHVVSTPRRWSPIPRPKGKRERTRGREAGSRCVGFGSGGRSGDSTFPQATSGQPAVRAEAPLATSWPLRPPDRAKPVAGKEVTPSAGRARDLLGEARQQMFDLPVRPFEKDLRDQVIGGRIAVIPHKPVRGLALTSSVDVEDLERHAKAFGQPLAVPYGKGHAVRTPLSKDDGQASRPILGPSNLHAPRNRQGRILGRRPRRPRVRGLCSRCREGDLGFADRRLHVA